MKKLFRHRPILSGLACAFVLLGILAIGGAIWYQRTFPYGQSHCCIINMMNSLQLYSEDHASRFPAGESSPEASLSLLCRSNYIDAYTIRGMTVPEKTVKDIIATGGLLGPDTCGWHYTPGLTKADDAGIALLYCKQPLGHNGDKTKDGGRQVVFIGNGIEWVSGEKWPAFLDEQKVLLSKRTNSLEK